MFNKHKEAAIALPLRDQYGNDNGLAILFKESVLSMFYDHNKGHLVINTVNTTFSMASKLQLSEEHLPELSNGKLVPDPRTGIPKTVGTGKYRNDVYTNAYGGNEQIVLTEEEDIVRFWNWINCGVEIDILLDKRKAHLTKLEEARKQAAERHKKELEEAEKALAEKLKNETAKSTQLRAVQPGEDPMLGPTLKEMLEDDTKVPNQKV